MGKAQKALYLQLLGREHCGDQMVAENLHSCADVAIGNTEIVTAQLLAPWQPLRPSEREGQSL